MSWTVEIVAAAAIVKTVDMSDPDDLSTSFRCFTDRAKADAKAALAAKTSDRAAEIIDRCHLHGASMMYALKDAITQAALPLCDVCVIPERESIARNAEVRRQREAMSFRTGTRRYGR